MATEKEFLGGRKGKMWTYLIFLGVLIVGALVANLALSNPTIAKEGVKGFFGLPSWALALVTFIIGASIFWVGLKVETDWPEALGAFLVAGSIIAGEIMIGWDRFNVGGLFVVPYLLPVAVFLVMLMYGMKKSV
ncbi:MAG: hypothetical protein K8M05_26115 [Deltaproteobacteria bacterium]|nr:hypothetical protein [Kofleriaceae bacterium]